MPGLRAVLGSLGAIWLLTEIADFLFEGAQDWFRAQTALYIGSISTVALLTFLVRVYEPRSVQFAIPTTNTHLNIKYGNLFDEQADLIVAVNEFFDGDIGQVVSPDSVHGQFIARYFQSHAPTFRAVVDPLLALHLGEDVTRPNLPATKYPIGTTLMVPIGAQHAFVVALATTDIQTHRASTTVANFWLAVTNALESVYHLNNGRPLALPLIGNGRSSLNLEPQHLLRLLVLAIIDTARKMQLPEKITITLPEACFDKLDLREIAGTWRK
ncbi:MAG: hypothetical protein KF780_00505 [Sphingomonas sp.]|nr:hypothetical protein [Sphingomonas sp.]